ncbi:son of sevenless homolog 1-like [Varroa destructor]|uniref:Son of sevenless n=1 Tax=Varroa destructor TaxID=109461 RepID=A0A7M7J1L8_VARDE|nr:son of sevenless homolog 1-like [Varroa destructor]
MARMFSPSAESSLDNIKDHKENDGSGVLNEAQGSLAAASRWRGLLVPALQKLHCQVHPTLTASAEALDYVEALILRLLATLCAGKPHSTQEVEDRVARTFPKPLDHVATKDALQALERWRASALSTTGSTLRRPRLPGAGTPGGSAATGHGLTLPVERLHTHVRELVGHKVEMTVSLFVCAVLEYIARDILKLTGNYVKNIRHSEVTLQDCRVAMCADPVLDELFCFTGEEWADERPPELTELPEKNTYASHVTELLTEEREHIKTLQLITKVFRHTLRQLCQPSISGGDHQGVSSGRGGYGQSQAQGQNNADLVEDEPAELRAIFGNIDEILEFSAALLSSFEDVVEMTDEDQVPALGSCFYDMAESYEFDVFEDYAEHVASPQSALALQELLERPYVHAALQRSSHGLWLAARYVMPRLLWAPVFHCLTYFDAIRAMTVLAVNEEDRESLEQTDGLIGHLKAQLTAAVANSPLKRSSAASIEQGGLFLRRRSALRHSAAHKLNELSRCVDGWSELQQREIAQTCQEFVLEGPLHKLAAGSNRRPTERYAFLFDGLLLLCKPASAQSRSRGQPDRESYKLKEKFFIRKMEVADRADTDDVRHALELIGRPDGGSGSAGSGQSTIVLVCKSAEDKLNWLASLVAVNTRSYLERSLDSILSAEEKQHPLRLPDNYKFSEPDLPANIVFEEKSTGGVPLIKGATLYKLVERLTFHMYADPSFVRTFLTTFRSFCQPRELLELLVERYNIPDHPDHADEAESCSIEPQQMAKRFRKEYQQPVQVRVLNVIRHWIEHHYYDFERDRRLLEELRDFLERMRADARSGKNMRKWIDSISKAVQRKQEQQGTAKELTFSHEPPPLEWYLARPGETDRFDLLTLHPVEVARQLTLLEFELYRAVQPSELVNAAWTKKDKQRTSPNLLKIIHHSSDFSFYLERLIVECQNLEERVAVVSRCIEMMVVLQELNNFTGVFAVSSALQSAPVHRLEHTQAAVRSTLRKALDDVLDLQSDHWRKYQERLRSINPPCVPFLGMYLTNILHIEEGNPDMIVVADGAELINFSKRRKVAEITGEIQQYQNQPYNLTVEKNIRVFLEQLSPQQAYQSEKELNDYLYQCSLQIEPRGARYPLKAPRRWPELSLKSPGIKVATQRQTTRPAVPAVLQSSAMTLSSSSSNSIVPSATAATAASATATSATSCATGLGSVSNNASATNHNHMPLSTSTGGCAGVQAFSSTSTSSATSPNPPQSPEDVSLLPPLTPTSPPSSAGDTIHVPVLVPMLDPPPPHHPLSHHHHHHPPPPPHPLPHHHQHHHHLSGLPGHPQQSHHYPASTHGGCNLSQQQQQQQTQQQQQSSMPHGPISSVPHAPQIIHQLSLSLSLQQQQQGSQSVAPPPVHKRQHSHPASLSGVFFPPSPSSPNAPGNSIAGAGSGAGTVSGSVSHASQRFAFPDAVGTSLPAGAVGVVPGGTLSTGATASGAGIVAIVNPMPPPLPPRARRDDSTSPALPPRGVGHESPPPLPPRKQQAPGSGVPPATPHTPAMPVSSGPHSQHSSPAANPGQPAGSPPVLAGLEPAVTIPTAAVGTFVAPGVTVIAGGASASTTGTGANALTAVVGSASSAGSQLRPEQTTPLLPPKTHKKPRPPPLIIHQSNAHPR